MKQILVALPLLACPVGMGLMMWFMSRGMRGDRTEARDAGAPSLASLRAERAELERQIAQRESSDSHDDELVRSPR